MTLLVAPPYSFSMKEDFLHHVWKFQKLKQTNYYTTQGHAIEIINVGQHNVNAGPDFLCAELRIDEQHWAGHVEIHIKSSDWYLHHHEQDPAYDSVILHVVWEHSAVVFRKDNTEIPTLVLSEIVNPKVISSYQKLFSKKAQWIPCETHFPKVDQFEMELWLERLFFERLEKKSDYIMTSLTQVKNHWEALFFMLLAKNFGLKVNGDAFYNMASRLQYAVLHKCSSDMLDLESLLFGCAGILEQTEDDLYFLSLQNRFDFLRKKFRITEVCELRPRYFRLRPANFPTLRISQLAMLYHTESSLFSKVIEMKSLSGFYELFDVTASDYWDTHYNFGLATAKRKKRLSKSFIDLLLINTVIPMKFCYAKHLGKDISEELIALTTAIKAEENSVIAKFNALRPIAANAIQSQGLLQLKNEYCNKAGCLKCAVGTSMMKS